MLLICFTYLLLWMPVQPVAISPVAAEEVIVEMALEAIQKQFDDGELRFNVSPRWIPGSLRELSPQHIQSVQLQGSVQKYTNFQVVYRDYSGSEKAEVQMKVTVEQKVPVTRTRMVSGEVLTAEALEWQWVTIAPGRDHPVTDMQQLAGKTLRRTLNAGQFISNEYISTGFMVEAGEEVGMIFRENGLQIVLRCEARQNGALREEIQIYCKETRKKYAAKITGPGEAQWLKTH